MFGDCNDDVDDDYCDVNVDDCNIYDCHVNFCDYDLTHSWSLPRRYGEGTDRNEEALEASFNSSTKSSCTNVRTQIGIYRGSKSDLIDIFVFILLLVFWPSWDWRIASEFIH